jgi:hypothetical protein
MVEKVHKFNVHCPNVYFKTGKEEKPMRVEEKNFILTKQVFLFSSIWTPPKLITFLFLLHFK